MDIYRFAASIQNVVVVTLRHDGIQSMREDLHRLQSFYLDRQCHNCGHFSMYEDVQYYEMNQFFHIEMTSHFGNSNSGHYWVNTKKLHINTASPSNAHSTLLGQCQPLLARTIAHMVRDVEYVNT